MSEGPSAATFSPVVPHFFKIILDKTLQENKLLLPKRIVRLYGKSLLNSVYVKLPCGTEWEMELAKDEGRVWLGKGWEKFAEHYEIVRGFLLCFRYEGNSRFNAVIFDTSNVEVDYPYKRRCEDDSVENSVDFIARPRTKKKISSPCSRVGKRRRISPVEEFKTNPPCSKREESRSNKMVLHKSQRKGDSLSFKSEIEGLEKVNCFTSDRPFFKVVMQPCYINCHSLNIPTSFARKYIENKSTDVILKVSNGMNKKWLVTQKLATSGRNVKAIMNCGWNKFARENNLEIGDVCMFVLLKGLKIVTYEVVIFRVKGNSKPPKSSGSTRVVWCEKFSSNKTKHSVDMENKTLADKHRILKIAHFVSEKPFFKLFMQPSYTKGRTSMPIPLDIAQKYFKEEGDFVLRVPNSGSWPMQIKLWRLKKTGRIMAAFSGGWQIFAKENNLKAGDVCIFQVIDGKKSSFEVSIIRVPDDDPYCQQFKEIDSESDGAMMNESRKNYLRDTSPIHVDTARQRALTMVERRKFLESAYFESKNPFFKVVVQPAYTIGYNMPVPYEFAQKYIKKVKYVILRLQHSTSSWPARFRLKRLMSGRLNARFGAGWKEFAKSNYLRVGDVCIFELTNKTDITFNVSIIRAGFHDVRQRRSQDGDSSKCADEIETEMKGVKIEVD